MSFLDCPFCGNKPVLTRRITGDTFHPEFSVRCECGVSTIWIPTHVYDKHRFECEGPEQRYGGAYYKQDYESMLQKIWNSRVVNG